MFIAYGTWKWIEAHAATSNAPIYRYRFDEPVPVPEGFKVNGQAVTGKDVGARHAGEIEYVFGAFATTKVPWLPEDTKVSELMMAYWSNFAKTSDPNGPGLPVWPRYDKATASQVMYIDGRGSKAAADPLRSRYEFLDELNTKSRAAAASK
jgi:para-nitrobenzyl esterase